MNDKQFDIDDMTEFTPGSNPKLKQRNTIGVSRPPPSKLT